MELKLSISEELNPISIEKIVSFIASIQKENGEIPWSAGGKTDPWDHVESAMGLSVGGFYAEARRAYEWLANLNFPMAVGGRKLLMGKLLILVKNQIFLPMSPWVCFIII
jgi:hypothetical protein